MPKSQLTTEILTAALEGFEVQKKRLEDQIAELKATLSAESTKPAASPEPAKRKRTLSAAARKLIGAAQKKRWANLKKTSEIPSQPLASAQPKKQRKFSAAGKLAIREAAKRRWAKVKAAQQAAEPAAATKSAPKKTAAKKAAVKATPKKAKKSVRKKVAKTAPPAVEATPAQ
jgi:hypothetical protein